MNDELMPADISQTHGGQGNFQLVLARRKLDSSASRDGCTAPPVPHEAACCIGWSSTVSHVEHRGDRRWRYLAGLSSNCLNSSIFRYSWECQCILGMFICHDVM